MNIGMEGNPHSNEEREREGIHRPSNEGMEGHPHSYEEREGKRIPLCKKEWEGTIIQIKKEKGSPFE